MRRRGLTLVEIIVTLAVLAVGILVIVSSFSVNLRESTQTRERILADLVMENLIEEILAHPYGAPEPTSWKTNAVDFQFLVEGRAQESHFIRDVDVDTAKGNGSFFGTSSSHQEDTDVLILTVKWTESSGVGNKGQDKSLSLDLTVRREP